MRRLMQQSVVAVALTLLAATVAVARVHAVARPTVSARTGIFDDPGVIVIRTPSGPEIVTVFFGAKQSPLVQPNAPDFPGASVAVPPGEAGTSVAVLVVFSDGSSRKLGKFKYVERIEPTRKTHWVGGAINCRLGGFASTSSSVRRLPGNRFRYTYQAWNHGKAPVTVTWPAVERLGLEGGPVFALAGGERRTITRIAGGVPVEVRSTATTPDITTDCPGVPWLVGTWDAPAIYPKAELPVVTPVEDLQATSDHTSIVTWTYPASAEPADEFEVTTRTSQLDLNGRPKVAQRVRVRNLDDGAARKSSVSTGDAGVFTISVRAFRDGVASAPAIVTISR